MLQCFAQLYTRLFSTSKAGVSHIASVSTKHEISFFDLPAELRNQIYRDALIEEYHLVVDECVVEEPALLYSCKKIREEAIGIFYLENAWYLDIPSWQYTNYKGFYDHLRNHRGIQYSPDPSSPDRLTTIWYNSSPAHKANLLEFIKMLHHNRHVFHIIYKDQKGVDAAAYGALEIAHRMEEQSWELVEQVLEVYFQEVSKARNWKWIHV